jgi:hypothetical protein
MDENNIATLTANVVATQAVIVRVLGRLMREHPTIAAAIRHGFDDAATQAENTAILGKLVPADHSVKTFGIIEELRAATLGNPNKPKHRI